MRLEGPINDDIRKKLRCFMLIFFYSFLYPNK